MATSKRALRYSCERSFFWAEGTAPKGSPRQNRGGPIPFPDGFAMSRERDFVSPVERLARQMCKLLSDMPPIDRADLQERLVREARIDTFRLAAKWRRRIAPRAGDFVRAVELAQERGWIVEHDGAVSLTERGQDLARRSRVGHLRSRTTFLTSAG